MRSKTLKPQRCQHAFPFIRRKKRSQHLAHRGAIKRAQDSDACGHPEGMATLDYIHVEDILSVQNAEIHSLARFIAKVLQYGPADFSHCHLICGPRTESHQARTNQVSA